MLRHRHAVAMVLEEPREQIADPAVVIDDKQMGRIVLDALPVHHG